MIEIIQKYMAANSPVEYAIQGEYFEVLDAQYPIDVFLIDRFGVQLTYLKSAEASFFARPGKFEAIKIVSAQAQYLRVMVGTGDVGTRRISSTVSVVDGGRARVDAGVSYAGSALVAPPVDNYGFIQLWNPGTSGMRLVVNQLSVSLSAASGANVYFGSIGFGTVVNGAISSKKSQVAAASGQIRTQISAVAPAMTLGLLQQLGGSPGVFSQWKPTEPIVVMPGYGLNVVTAGTNMGMSENMEWFEESIQ